MLLATLSTILILTLSVGANGPILVNKSPVTLPLARRLNLTSVHNLVRHDQTRAKILKAKGAAAAGLPFHADAVISSPIDNQAVSYIASVGVGCPATNYNLIVDTGSSNFVVSAPYTPTSCSTKTQDSGSISQPVSFSCTEFIDRVTITPELVILKQSICVGPASSGFSGADGIIGLGPVDLTLGTLSPDTNTLIPTVTDNLFSQGTISADEIAISFEPTTTAENMNGEITWGGTNSSRFTGSITFIPVTTTSPSSMFWGINQSVLYSSATTILATTAGIVDTGTTLVLLASDAFSRYLTVTGAKLDPTTGLATITSTQFTNLKSLFFIAGGSSFEFTANAQLWPRSLNTAIGGTTGQIYLIVNDIGSPSGQGLDFINGFAFLERFYSVFDTTNNRVGLATTSFTMATSN